jgi:dipeptidyl aminopeptidase/acylaminoacyl peptidase
MPTTHPPLSVKAWSAGGLLRAVFAALVFLSSSELSVAARPWRLTDMFSPSFPWISDVQIAPDGTHVLAKVSFADLQTNTFTGSYRLVDIKDGTWQPMSAHAVHPRWSPSGSTIAWIDHEKDSAARILLTDSAGQHSRMLTAGTRWVLAFGWSPDGSTIAAIEVAPARNDIHPRLQWLGANNDFLGRIPARRELWEIDVATGRERLMTDDQWSYGGMAGDNDPSFSSDGTHVAAVRQPSPVFEDFDREEYVTVDVASGSVHAVVGHPFFAYPGSAPPKFSPAGSDIAYVQTWDGKLPSREDLFVGNTDVTAELDRDLWSCTAGRFEWQPGMLVAGLLDGVSERIFRIDPPPSVPKALTSSDGSVDAFSVAHTGRIAFTWTTPTQPPDIYVLDPGSTPRRVTHFASVPTDLPIAKTHIVEWSGSNGHTLQGQLTYPAGGNPAELPIVMEPHGGPQCADDSAFDPLAQYLASNGYAYFRPDPRGSDGYGDWSYKALVNDYGAGPMADDLAGLDAVIASGVGDTNRLYIEGASYGGYLTSWIVTHTSRFKAAVAQVPVTDLLLEYTLSDDSNIERRFFGEKPATTPQFLREQSPLTYAGAERTPLLIIIGLRDTRAPYPASIEFYKTLLEDGAPVRLIADPLAGHFPKDPKGILAWDSATFGWLAQHGAPTIADALLPN